MVDHEDYQETADPTAHAESHEDGGTDEISLAALSGTPAALAAHALLPTVHQDAPGLIGVHALLASVHHLRYTDVEAKAAADIQIGIHAALPTVHQDAPGLIGVHALLASIHHTKYTDIEAKAAADVQIGIHAGLPTVHQDAPDLILTHKADASAHHAKYTDVQAKAAADVQIAIHALLATVHQDAPDLILTHKGDASAHHAKYTDAAARAAAVSDAAYGVAWDGDTTHAPSKNAVYDQIQNRGTWTAELRGATTRATPPVEITALYTKIGNTVIVQGHFANVDTTGATGGLRVVGLPFTNNNTMGVAASLAAWIGLAVIADHIPALLIDPNTAFLKGYQVREDGLAQLDWAITAGAGKYLYFGATYII